jgi:hypothetical protein
MSEWTKETPKEVGWYWLKPDPEYSPGLPEGVRKPLMVAVHSFSGQTDRFFFEDPINHEEYECEQVGRLWSGPIKPPD